MKSTRKCLESSENVGDYRGSENGCVRHRAKHRNHVWSYDFLSERTEDGRQLRILVVIDEFTRECLAIEVARSFTARDIVVTLQYLFAVRGAPEHLRSDNGPEFVAKGVQEWLKQSAVGSLYIQKASPWENGYVESLIQLRMGVESINSPIGLKSVGCPCFVSQLICRDEQTWVIAELSTRPPICAGESDPRVAAASADDIGNGERLQETPAS